ncbi:site-specific DNA-methyltransferase [Klebsiella michiganensis]|nr:site-specific DNA-methyltransferase [Klebsiella michiganensis]ELR9570288.1 site-specific DNA-methyltransferase [Klebsiella michiganensis]
MSRLTDLIARARIKDSALGEELEKEFKALSLRRAFGLNFERHKPESIELPGRPVRKGDKVRILPPRGSHKKGDQSLWKVIKISKVNGARIAELVKIGVETPETKDMMVDDLVVVAEFRDYIYPGLVSTGKVERGGNKPFHTVINGENFHALEALTYTHRGKIDAIYIDPPYNSGAKDWKYNNDYVEAEDIYRHSKWLAMIERRLLIAKELLNPENSVLIVSIDEKEYLRLGLLIEQIFNGEKVQMVSSAINATGTIRVNEFTRINEYIFFVLLGDAKIEPELVNEANSEVPWNLLQRREMPSRRGGPKPGPDQFYPIYIDTKKHKIHKIGDPLPLGVDKSAAPEIEGCLTLFPMKPDGTEMTWGLNPGSLQTLLDRGFVKVTANKRKGSQGYSVYYLTSGKVKALDQGQAVIRNRNPDGSVNAFYVEGQKAIPTTMWLRESHNAQSHGTKLLSKFLPDRKFPYPKSLYAVEDALRFFVKNNPNAIILDFFAGSGTTAHAIMRLNRQDNGNRQSISVTNNEVSADEQLQLRNAKLRPGDKEWEMLGICEYITKPRIQASITGKTPEGTNVKGEYKFYDGFPMEVGFEENAEFFTLTYETPVAVQHNIAFERIAPLLWMRAGSQGRRIEKIPNQGWDVVENYGVLVDLDQSTTFCKALKDNKGTRIAYIVTDDDRRFQAVARYLPDSVEPVRLYESYLSNFRFSMGR